VKFKIFCVPGDNRDDFRLMEDQLNAWSAESKPRIVDIRAAVNSPDAKSHGKYTMTVIVMYEPPA